MKPGERGSSVLLLPHWPGAHGVFLRSAVPANPLLLQHFGFMNEMNSEKAGQERFDSSASARGARRRPEALLRGCLRGPLHAGVRGRHGGTCRRTCAASHRAVRAGWTVLPDGAGGGRTGVVTTSFCKESLNGEKLLEPLKLTSSAGAQRSQRSPRGQEAAAGVEQFTLHMEA